MAFKNFWPDCTDLEEKSGRKISFYEKQKGGKEQYLVLPPDMLDL